MTRAPFDADEHVDGTDFLAKTIIEPERMEMPVGFVVHKPRVRVKAVSVKREPVE